MEHLPHGTTSSNVTQVFFCKDEDVVSFFFFLNSGDGRLLGCCDADE